MSHLSIKQRGTICFWIVFCLGVGVMGLPALGWAQLKAYVTNSGGNTVTAIDFTTFTVDTSYTVGTAPIGLAADPPRNFLYVANSGSASVSRINVGTGNVTTLNLPVGALPEGVAVRPGGDLILVSSQENRPDPGGPGSKGVIYVIDGTTFTILDEVLTEDDPEGVVIAPDGNQAWIAADLKTQELELKPGVDFLTLTNVTNGVDGMDDFEEVAVKADKSVLFATNATRNWVDVIDLGTELNITTVATGANPEAVKLRPTTDEMWVTNQSGNSITLFSQTTYSVITTMPLTLIEPRGIAFTPDGALGCVAMAGSNRVIKFDAAGRSEITNVTVGAGPEEVVIFQPAPAGLVGWQLF